jgi:hypothetical protein
MRYPTAALVLALLFAGSIGRPILAAEAELDPEDVKILREAGIPLDNKALLDFLRARTLADIDRTKILALVRQLGDDDFLVRAKASDRLEALGAPAVPLLRQALRDDDIEIVHRAQKCLQHIEKVAGLVRGGSVDRASQTRRGGRDLAGLSSLL